MTDATRNRHLTHEIRMFQLIVGDFESANEVRHQPDEFRYTDRGKKKRDWGRFNFEWAERLKELFDG